MDIIEASDYGFLLSRRTKKAIALALIIGIAFLPPVKRWYVGQIEHHAQQITRQLVSELTDTAADAPQEPGRGSKPGG